MSAILFLNRSRKSNAAALSKQTNGHGRQYKRPGHNQRRPPRNHPNHVVVTKQPISATVVNMEHTDAQSRALKSIQDKPPSSYLCLGLLCLCVCPLFAAFAIFFSIQVKPTHARGNTVGAKMSSRFALLFCILSILTTAGVTVYLIYIWGVSSSTTARDNLSAWWNSNWNFA